MRCHATKRPKVSTTLVYVTNIFPYDNTANFGHTNELLDAAKLKMPSGQIAIYWLLWHSLQILVMLWI